MHYGPISAGDRELKLLGKVEDRDAVEIGCGGGQNAIGLAKWGARSVGLDISEEQIKHALKLARKEKVRVPFHVGNMEDLSVFKAARASWILERLRFMAESAFHHHLQN